jgi:hypothetical protein
MNKILKSTHKNLMLDEAFYIYCLRHNLNYDDESLFEEYVFNYKYDDEIDRITIDLRCYLRFNSYKLKEITEEEYEKCILKFGHE